DGHLLDRLERGGQVVAQAGRRRARIGAEGGDHALLVGLHDIEAGEGPQGDRRAGDGGDRAGAHAARAAEEGAGAFPGFTRQGSEIDVGTTEPARAAGTARATRATTAGVGAAGMRTLGA